MDLGRRVRDQRGGTDPGDGDGTKPEESPAPSNTTGGDGDGKTPTTPSAPTPTPATTPAPTPAPAPAPAPTPAPTPTTTTTSSTVQSPPQYGIWVAGVTLFSILGFTFWATSVETFESQVDVDVEKLAQISQESRVQGPRGQRDYTTPTLTYAVGTLSVIAYSLLRSK